MKLSLAIALFKLVTAIFAAFQKSRWYQDGKAAAYAELDELQRERVAAAEAAARDLDDMLRTEPDRLRDDDGHRRD